MPSRVTLRFEVMSTGRAEPRHLRALVSNLIEWGDRGDHHANTKTFTTAPPQRHGDGFEIPVATLDQASHERLLVRAGEHARQRTVLRFGQLQVRLTPDPVAEMVTLSYRDLAEMAASAPELDLEFLTPTVFRSGRQQQLPFPLPTLVYGHYRNRWNTFAPTELSCGLAFDDLVFRVESFELHSQQVVDAHRRHRPASGRGSAGSQLVEVRFVGFVGAVTYSVTDADADARRWLHTLASLASFCGTGANTTIGMGTTRYLTPEVA